MSNYKDTLLISPDTIKANTNINYNVSDDTISRAIVTSQNIYLREIVGEALLDTVKELEYKAIISQIPNIDSAQNAVYKTLLNDYIKPYLEARTQVEILIPISFDIRNIGAGAGKYDTNIAQTNIQNVKYMKETYMTFVCDAENRLIKYLEDNKDSYPELAGCPCTLKDNKLYERAVNTGLWLK